MMMMKFDHWKYHDGKSMQIKYLTEKNLQGDLRMTWRSIMCVLAHLNGSTTDRPTRRERGRWWRRKKMKKKWFKREYRYVNQHAGNPFESHHRRTLRPRGFSGCLVYYCNDWQLKEETRGEKFLITMTMTVDYQRSTIRLTISSTATATINNNNRRSP